MFAMANKYYGTVQLKFAKIEHFHERPTTEGSISFECGKKKNPTPLTVLEKEGVVVINVNGNGMDQFALTYNLSGDKGRYILQREPRKVFNEPTSLRMYYLLPLVMIYSLIIISAYVRMWLAQWCNNSTMTVISSRLARK